MLNNIMVEKILFGDVYYPIGGIHSNHGQYQIIPNIIIASNYDLIGRSRSATDDLLMT